jgi:hypothetical protein
MHVEDKNRGSRTVAGVQNYSAQSSDADMCSDDVCRKLQDRLAAIPRALPRVQDRMARDERGRLAESNEILIKKLQDSVLTRLGGADLCSSWRA